MSGGGVAEGGAAGAATRSCFTGVQGGSLFNQRTVSSASMLSLDLTNGFSASFVSSTCCGGFHHLPWILRAFPMTVSVSSTLVSFETALATAFSESVVGAAGASSASDSPRMITLAICVNAASCARSSFEATGCRERAKGSFESDESVSDGKRAQGSNAASALAGGSPCSPPVPSSSSISSMPCFSRHAVQTLSSTAL